MYRFVFLAAVSLVFAGSAVAQDLELSSAPDSARTYIVSPQDGDTVTNPFTVVFGLTDMGVAPAGLERMDTGHHHLLINTELPYLDEPIPANDNFIHFGGGQTEVLLDLPPGKHRLQLLMGDHNHIPHDPPVMSKTITIWVEEGISTTRKFDTDVNVLKLFRQDQN